MNSRALTPFFSLFAFACVLFISRVSRADLRWDAGVDAGVMKRFLVSRPPGAGDAGFGPIVGLHGHFALLPMLRLGAYVDTEISPAGDVAPARRMYSGGFRLKFTPPAAWAASGWAFVGFGYTGVYAPSYHAQLAINEPGCTTPQQDIYVAGAGGQFFEIPFGIGKAFSIRKPWEITVELAGRFAIAESGTLYSDARPASIVGGCGQFPGDSGPLNAGHESFAVSLTIGFGLDL